MSPKKSKTSQDTKMNDELAELLHIREVVCARLDRFKKYLKENRDKNVMQIEIRLKSVSDDFAEFDKCQTRIEFLDPDEIENRLDIEDSFYETISFAKTIINSRENDTKEKSQHGLINQVMPVNAVAKLPDLGLPNFNGTYDTWLSFKDIFNSVVDKRTDINNVEKFLYLKLCCKDEALKLIEPLEVIESNYKTAWELLEKRYDNKRAMVNHHVNNLLFKLPEIQKESSHGLRKLLDTVYHHTTALEKLNLPVQHWDALVIPIILNKIDDRTRREWENKQDDSNLPTLKQLIDFLTKKCFTLEALNLDISRDKKGNKIDQSQKPSKSFLYPRNSYENQQKYQSYSSSYSVTQGRVCVICKDRHFIYHCPKFASLSLSDKYKEVRNNKLCPNCLRPGHLKHECLSSGCKKCLLKHNTLLHNSQYNHQTSDQVNELGNLKSQSGNTEYQRGAQETSAPSQTAELNNTVDLNRTPRQQINGAKSENPRPTLLVCSQNPTEIDRSEIKELFNVELTDKIRMNEQYQPLLETSYAIFNTNQVLLSTATILIEDSDGNWQKCHALLDSGSQSNLISQSLCKKLKLKCYDFNIPLSGINQTVSKITKRTFANIKSRFKPFKANLSFLILPTITEKLPLIEFPKSAIKYPKHINLADEEFNIPKDIDILIGASIFYDLLENEKIKLGKNMPVLQKTCLGWIFTGSVNFNSNRNQKTVCNFVSNNSNKELQDTLMKFWQVEEISNQKTLSKKEQYCEDYFKNTTVRNKDGRFVVKFPFIENYQSQLGDSKTTALKRYLSLEARLEKNEYLKTEYINFMREYESLNHMTEKCELNADNSIENLSYFLPHTAVLRDSITTKCRVVFDASTKTSTDKSLNDLLLVGPTIQEDLISILLRLRLKEYVLSADIKMMYRCILIDPSQRSFQQILWRYKPDEPIKVYILNTVTYGTSCAPFQATRCLQELAIQNREKYPRTSKIIENSFYMDDLLVSVNSKKEAIEIYHEITKILAQSKFELRKWSSNDKSILDYISQSSNSKDEKLILFHDKKELKTLGISWDANTDLLKYSVNVKINENNITKRTILSAIAQIFDPLGLIGPVIVKAKLIIQKLWRLQLDWDQEIPQEIKESWLEFASQLHLLNQIKIKRYVLTKETEFVELFGFSDSSERAYGACVYLSSKNKNGQRITQLLTAKSKVAPIKQLTLPRLELLAAHLLVELVNKVKTTVDIKISKTTYFTDSTIVLAWLKIEPCNLKTFVANRVSKITELSDIKDWKHVKTSDNIADIISRGISPKDLVELDTWFNGPEFLKNNTEICISQNNISLDDKTLPELKKFTNITLTTAEKLGNVQNSNKIDWFSKYSTLVKLQRIIAYIFRFKNRILKKTPITCSQLTVEELNESLIFLIKIAQRESFFKEITFLKNSKSIPSDSKILNLYPFLDSHDILRVGGRLTNSDLKYDERHPIILPNKHKLTDLIVSHYHLKYLHMGAQNLLSILRLKYWPINGKNVVKNVIRLCVRCFRVKPKPTTFLMGSLPKYRVLPSRPFSNCGIDYAGPIYVKENTSRKGRLVKTYISIFVCFSTRAVHLELVNDLTTESFLNALKRFCSRRGKPSDIFSDNGLNFIGANNYFLELYKLINNEKHNETVSKFLANDQIKWHFIPAKSAHVGGLWEAAVKSTKFHLKRVVGNASLNYEEMYTLLTQIEACLNSRPLTPISTDINDYLPLTPSHFLIGDSLVSPPQMDVKDLKQNRLSKYLQLQQIYQHFWDRWYREYLTNLQARSKWKKNSENSLKIGSLVVLIEDNMAPLRWPMARVVKMHPGKDNVVRVVSVQLPNKNIVKRAISKICLLPVETEELPKSSNVNG